MALSDSYNKLLLCSRQVFLLSTRSYRGEVTSGTVLSLLSSSSSLLLYFSMHCPVHPVMLSPISGPIALKEDANLLTELGVLANSGHSVIILLLLLLL